MKKMAFVVGLAAGMAAASAVLTSMYPDVSRRLARDTRRVMRSGRKMAGGMFGN